MKLILEVPGRLTNLFRHYKREASKVASFKGLEVSLRSPSTKVLTNMRSLILEKPKLSKFSKVSNEKLGPIQNFEIFIFWYFEWVLNFWHKRNCITLSNFADLNFFLWKISTPWTQFLILNVRIFEGTINISMNDILPNSRFINFEYFKMIQSLQISLNGSNYGTLFIYAFGTF